MASIAGEKAGEGERQALMKPSKAKEPTPSPHSERQGTSQSTAGPPAGIGLAQRWKSRSCRGMWRRGRREGVTGGVGGWGGQGLHRCVRH